MSIVITDPKLFGVFERGKENYLDLVPVNAAD